MMVTRWLDHPEFGERFRGTIRVNPDDIAGALREIDKYKDHPRVVQLGVPLQSRELYGKPQFWPLWEAAVDAGPAGRSALRGRIRESRCPRRRTASPAPTSSTSASRR